MSASPLDVSPMAHFLVELAERRPTGSVSFGGRELSLSAGEVVEVTAAPGDPDLGRFLVEAGRLSTDQLRQVRALASDDSASFEAALLMAGLVPKADLRSYKRSLWLDRLVFALRDAAGRDEPLPAVEHAAADASHGASFPLLDFALDALTRLAAEDDAVVVGRSINFRLVWASTALVEEAKRWAAFGAVPDRTVVSSILARSPAVAPQIAALARAGLVRLEPPGATFGRPRSKVGTLPPPPPRLSNFPAAPPAPPAPTTPSRLPPSPARAPRLRFEPGADGVPIERIPDVELRSWPSRGEPLSDPLRPLELRIAQLEERSAPGPERARVFVELARLWQARIGSLEEAARALREAAAADPSDARVLQEAALHCSYLGQMDLAVAYAEAAVAASPISIERSAAHRLLAEIHRAAGHDEACIEALCEAAADDPTSPEPHELLAYLLAQRDNLPLAVEHARAAARAWAEHEPRRAAMLYATAYGWNPSDPLLSEEYATVLDSLGYHDAAAAILAETARNVPAPEPRARVLQMAARRAEAAGWLELAAELLTEVFELDVASSATLLELSGLVESLGLRTEQAALLEAVAASCPRDERPVWLLRAAKSLLAVEGEQENAALLLARAVREDPGLAEAEALLQSQGYDLQARAALARGDAERAAALERELRDHGGGAGESALLSASCAAQARLGDTRAVASTALRLLALEPRNPMAIARLWVATSRLGDPVLRREALTLRARARSVGRSQAVALAALARKLEAMGDVEGALASAQSALACDARAADAAIVVLRHAHHLEAARAVALLERARELLGDSPPLLLSLAHAARAASDGALHLSVLHELSEGCPLLPEPRLLALDFHLAQTDPFAIVEESEALLRDAGGPYVVARVKDAAVRLSELGHHAEATRLLLRALDEQGHADADQARLVVDLARRAEDPELLTSALERAAACASPRERLDLLLSIAEHHRKREDRVAEQRALLRALALDPRCSPARDELVRLFAGTSDAPRLLAVLTLGLHVESDTEARRRLRLDLASAAAYVGDDRELAVSHIASLLAECHDDRAWLLRALGALFSLGEPTWALENAKRLANDAPADVGGAIYAWLAHHAETRLEDSALALSLATEGARRFPAAGELLLLAERLTLHATDRERAKQLYEDLLALAIGPHGQRALHYRAGRWLERAGDCEAALSHYTTAFELSKGAGVAYKAVERVARATSRFTTLLEVQETLAETVRDDRVRIQILREAARTAHADLGDPDRAFSLLLRADELVGASDPDPTLLETARSLSERDAHGSRRGFAELASAWRKRADKLWDGDAKFQLLANAARLLTAELDDAQEAMAMLAPLFEGEVGASATSEARVAALTAYAEAALACGRRAEAERALEQALSLQPESSQAQALRERLASGTSGEPETRRMSVPAPRAVSTHPAADRPRRSSIMPPSPPSAQEATLRARAEAGETDAMRELLELLSTDATRRTEAHYFASQLARAEPHDTAHLRRLHESARSLGAAAELEVTAEILALFDGNERASPAREGRFAGLGRAEIDGYVHAGRKSPTLARLLALLWENARVIPRYRRTLERYGLAARMRLTPQLDGGAARTFVRASRLLGGSDAAVYLTPRADADLAVVPTHPPSIVVRADLAETDDTMYAMARCVLWARPEHALTCVLDEEDGRELLLAAKGAFGPAGIAETLSKSSKELASALWHTVPMRTQAELRELVATHLQDLDYDRLRDLFTLASHRAGVLAVGHAGHALRALAASEPTLADVDLSTEAGFRDACARSPSFGRIVSSMLDEAYLTLVAQAGLQQPRSTQMRPS